MGTLRGDWRSETLVRTDEDDYIFGAGGDDTILGGEGNDELRGGDGNDQIFGMGGDDEIHGDAGDDILSGGGGDDNITAWVGVDDVLGGIGNDTIHIIGGDWTRFDRASGGDGNDEIRVEGTKVLAFGGNGRDTLFTDLGRETVLVGGAGSDRFVVTAAASGDGRVAELHGGDVQILTTDFLGTEGLASIIALGDTSIDTLDLSDLVSGSLYVDMSEGTVSRLDVDYAYFTGIEDVIGSSERDIIHGDSAHNRLEGRGGDDLLTGGAGDDTLYGGEGRDWLYGREDADRLFGDAGDDELNGEGGDDALFGGLGNDILRGGSDSDALNGEAGDDTLEGGSGHDNLFGGTGRDTLRGGSGMDILYGDTAGEGVNADVLTGGADFDRFVFMDVANNVSVTFRQTSMLGGQSQAVYTYTPILDTITDFDTSGADHDVIDIGRLMRTKTGFMGTTYDQAVSGGYLYFVQYGRAGTDDFGTKVMIDLNGGTHFDAATNFGIADVKGVFASEMRADLFIL